MVVYRDGSSEGHACWSTMSYTDGHTWSTPQVMQGTPVTPHSVEPQLVRLGSLGVVLLSSGREGQYVWAASEDALD